jgi:hypothetical protein
MILSFDYIGYKHLSENKRFPNHRWYSDATWGEMGEGSPLPFNIAHECISSTWLKAIFSEIKKQIKRVVVYKSVW